MSYSLVYNIINLYDRIERQVNRQMTEEVKEAPQDKSIGLSKDEDESHSFEDSVHEDAVEEPKFVPMGGDKSASILKRRATLPANRMHKIEDKTEEGETAATTEGHNRDLDCVLCKNIMLDPRSCNKCRKGYCKECINDYIDQLINGEYEVGCPCCGSKSFELVDPHPRL